MVTDIKGVGYCLCDPEIPSVQQVYVEDNVVYHHVTWHIRSAPALSLFEVLFQGSCSRLNLLLVKIVIV